MRMQTVLLGIGAAGAAAVALGAVFWVATGGVPPASDRPSWLVERPIAHRGLWVADGTPPENSLSAFKAAADSGVPIELDVHTTSDGVVVVIHDDTLDRMTGDPRAVADVSLAELGKLRLKGTQERVPTFADVLDLVGGRVPLFVEIKNQGRVGPLEDAVVREISSYPGKVAFVSFNPYSLGRVAERAPRIPRGQLSGSFQGEDLAGYKKFLLGHLLMNWKSRPSFIAYEIAALPRWEITLQRKRGRYLVGWAAKDQATLDRGRRLCDAVMFDPGGRP